ncbi:SusC/RagA family TonB-linked outer membrane protein [Chitinophaga horti]|uniref:SusC/RagA family TonB-linked outer membrane protein n=1 Tax=Chitinophaga horti TaxID=2920382 RepID=A0ABY6J469_9BACT|nr:SusC/RagA family TonB-linked outer membrane protein [Chitinophaga horti]UYQ94461.1 SusC/RagA family TonB-linked outer membrane protein [Chitinophaga horti]
MSILLLLSTIALKAQTVTLKLRDEQLSKAFKEIEKQTGYTFIYGRDQLKGARPVTVNAINSPLNGVLALLFANQDLTYAIKDNKYIVVSAKQRLNNSNAVPNESIQFLLSGRVTDDGGTPLPGVSVRVLPTATGVTTTATTNDNGSFSLNAPDRSELQFSFIGHEPVTVEARAGKALSVVLKRTASKLEETVITGYTAKSAKELTGAVQRVTGEQLRNSVITPNALSMLKGKTTGLYITENSGESGAKGQVIERGQSSMATPTNGYFGPLIVVDGVITNYQNMQDAVNPADVEDIAILKDASSTAIYGSRAAQGVIVITTRRGKAGRTGVNLNMQYGMIQPVRDIRFMNTTELISFMDKQMQRYWEQTPSIQAQFPNVADFIQQRRVYNDADKANNFNWEDAIYSNGNFRNTELNISSGNDKTKFYGGVAWYKENGALYDNSFDRKSVRLNIDQQVSKQFSVAFNVSSIIDKTIKRNGIPELYMIQPFQSPYKADGTYADSLPVKQSSNYGPVFTTWTQNFLAETAYDNTAITRVQNHLGAIKLKYDLFPWLSVQSANSINYMNTNANSYLDPRSYSGKFGGYPYLFNAASLIIPNGTLTIRDTRYTDYLTSNTINFRKYFGKHSVAVLAGQEWGKRTTEVMAADMYNVLPGERNAGAAKGYGSAVYLAYYTPATPPAAPIGSLQERATFSVFGQADYNYDQRYFASGSVRTDATTNFGRAKRYGTFYSISGGWLLSREGFLDGVKAINNLKLRAVYGTSGRDLGDGYLNTTFYTDGPRYGAQSNIGSSISQLANPDISWETMYSTNVGLDVSVWNRIDATIDLYHKRSSGLLQNVSLTSAQGSLTQYQNVGEIVNKGLELMLNGHAVKTKDFNWMINFNISFNKNELTSLYQDSLRDSYSNTYYRKLGEDINVIKAIEFVGINPDNGNMIHRNYDAAGKAVDVEGIGATTNLANWRPVGSATPKFFGGFTNTFKYRQFTLSAEWWFQYGNYVMMSLVNNFQSPTAPRLGRNNVLFGDNQHVWEGPGDTKANYPDVFSTNPNAWSALTYRSSRLWGDASHARLRNVRFTYELPRKLIQQWKMQQFSAYVSGDNLWVLKRKDFVGADPEGATLSSNTAFGGVGTGFANPRRFVAGINVGF